ncbi:MAG: YkgJ family cysteine cluster protein [Desulfobulbaceae bacterium]|nr:YkgJ family cysteine cluster protein [Desulfobulbaceae bacterium]
MENITLNEICKNCAECCKHYSFVELSQIEINALEKFTGLRFDVFTNPKGKAVEEYFLKFKDNGDCYFLNVNNGNYSCGVYEARPDICRNYPSEPSQHEVCDANKKICLSNNSG